MVRTPELSDELRIYTNSVKVIQTQTIRYD